MALQDENMVMPVSPMGAYGNNGFGGDWAWIILLLLLGWGNNGFGGYGGNQLGYDFPWLMNGQQNINENTNNGFRDAMLNDGITSVRDGINGINTQLCNGFAGVEQGANARQIADMQQSFANQTAMMQGFNGVQSQLAECFCENRLGIANLGADIAREACSTRSNDTQNTQAILDALTSGVQSIKDQMCQDKIDEKNDTIAQLRQEILFARGKDSQDLQTQDIVNQTYSRLATCPVGTTPVYGNQPIFTCSNGGCTCGM